MRSDDSGRRRDVDAPEDEAPPWDADDQRRQKDCFAPPKDPCECWCMHCQRVFMSDRIWFQRVVNDPQGFEGFWMCPTPNCGGAGFTFDIFPTDPDHPANAGWHSCDDEEEEEGQADDAGPEAEWDPDEPEYHALGEEPEEEDDDDLEGEEWKYGLEPGERPAPAEWVEQGRREWEEREAKYDQPDERPRVVDWGDREDRREDRRQFDDDDIPF
jgi:hypothetical protein